MKILTSIAVLAVLVGGASAAQSNGTKTIKAYYAKVDKLTLKKDVEGLHKLMVANTAQDYLFLFPPDRSGKSKTRTRQETINDLEKVMPMIATFSKASTQVKKLVTAKDSIVAYVIIDIQMTSLPKGDGKIHKLGSRILAEDTWVRVGSDWKLRTSKSAGDSKTLDGKPFSQ